MSGEHGRITSFRPAHPENKVLHIDLLSYWTEGWQLSAKPVKTGMRMLTPREELPE